MFSTRSDNLPSVLFQPSLTVLSLSVGLTIFYLRAVPQYSFYFFIDVLVRCKHRKRQTAPQFVLTGLNTFYGYEYFFIQNFVSEQATFRFYSKRLYPISLTIIFGISIDLLKQLLRCVTSLLIFIFCIQQNEIRTTLQFQCKLGFIKNLLLISLKH